MKFKKCFWVLFIPTLLGTTHLFAATIPAVTGQEERGYLSQQEHLHEIFYRGETEVESIYSSALQVVDKYGNVMGVDSKWHGSTSVDTPFFLETRSKEGITNLDITRPYYYDGISTKVSIVKEFRLSTVIMMPTKIMNTVSGKVILTEGVQTDNLWIKVIPDSKEKRQDVVLKVQKDGTFKVENLMNGTYTIIPFEGEATVINDSPQWNVNDKFNSSKIIINGDTNLEINIEDTVDINLVYFKDIERSNPMAFVEHTETSNPPQLIKDMANLIKIKSGKKSDMQKVEEILKAMNSRDIVGYGNLRNHPLSDIIKDEKIYYESCGDYANVFVSLCRELGFPAVYVQGAEIGNGYSDVEEYRAKQRKLAEAHMNVEVYLPDMNKWILVEPHFCQVIEEYDTANPYVGYNGESVNLPKDGVYYFYIKSANNQFSRPHEFVLENIDTKVDITEQKYSKDYDFER